MLGILNMAGNALRSFGTIHPAIKWGVVAIVGLLAVEFVGKEAISLYVAMSTAKSEADAKNTENMIKVMQYHSALKTGADIAREAALRASGFRPTNRATMNPKLPLNTSRNGIDKISIRIV